MPTARSKPFSLTFHPCNEGEDPGPYKTKSIPINGPPCEIENATFKGSMILVHDTGNEPNAITPLVCEARKGVEMQIQGKFKRAVEPGGQTTHGLWVGGDLMQPLKLGWIMQNVVNLCMKFAKKKCEGRIQADVLGQVPHVSFPIGQLFTVVITPPGETAPPLGSPEFDAVKWQGAGWINIDTESTYTLIYKTPYLDICSWELLRVPGVSPLGLESILGDISSARVLLFDLGLAGKHSDWRKGSVLQWTLSRGNAGDGDLWTDDNGDDNGEDLGQSENRCMKTQDEDNSEGSERGSDGESVVAVEDQADAISENSGSSSSIEGSEEEEAMSIADTQALFEIEGWRPRAIDVPGETAKARIPFYIEAIDRRKKSTVRTWYVIAVSDGTDEFWIAKAASELATLCQPKRRLKTFWRGTGARKTRVSTVKTLEQFRHVVRAHLASDTKLRAAVMSSATALAENGDDESLVPAAGANQATVAAASRLTPALIAQKVRKSARRPKSARLLLPPRFFVGSGSACALAFAHASEGRRSVVRETIVGAIHFEGRIAEELLRLSNDGTLRCFTAYDCDKPRIKLKPSDIIDVGDIDGLFLGRFLLWQVQTVLRAFVFVSSDAQERAAWVAAVQGAVEAGRTDPPLPPPPIPPGTGTQSPILAPQQAPLQPLVLESVSDAGKRVEKPALEPMQESVSITSKKTRGRTSAEGGEDGDSVVDPRQTSLGHIALAADALRASNLMQRIQSAAAAAPGIVPQLVPRARVARNTLQAKVSHVTSMLRNSVAIRSNGGSSDLTNMLMDSSGARRWRFRRLVLNDRLLLGDSTLPPAPVFAEELLESALGLVAAPGMDAERVIAFSNALCKLKAVRFKSWTQNELLAFWLNIYHCLMLHGFTLLGRPNTVQEMNHFFHRVSYLVGLRCFSLRDIEDIVLKLPRAEPVNTVKRHAVGRAQQLKGLFALVMPFRRSIPEEKARSNSGTISPQPSNLSVGSGRAPHTDAPVVGTCLPMMTMPRVGKPSKQDFSHYCMFLGKEPEEPRPPKTDKRCSFVLNWGTHSCLAEIPVFRTNSLNAELDDVTRKFVIEFVHVEEKDGKVVRVDVPERLRPLEQDFCHSHKGFLEYLWQFMPNTTPQLQSNTKIKFTKSSEEPRPVSDFKKFVYRDPNLCSSSFGGLSAVGAEFDAIAGTAKQLAKLASRAPSAGYETDLVVVDEGRTTMLTL